MSNLGWQEGEHLIFVGGAPRSGTSLVQNILDSHPNIAGGTEFNLSKDFTEFRNRIHDLFGKSADYSVNTQEFCSLNDLDREIGFLIERLLLAYGEKKKKKYISEKTPSNILFFKDLLCIFPRAHFIFCLRDPRSVVSSLLEVGKRSKLKGLPSPSITTNILDAIDFVNRYNDSGFSVINNPRVRMVRYEDLVKSPEVETKRLCNWLNLDWSETLLTPELIQHDIEVGLNKGFSGIWYDKDKLYQKITTKNVWAWEEKLTDFSKAVLYLTYCENKMLSNFNYTFSNKGLSKATILTASIYLNAIRIFQKTTILILNKLYTYAKKNNRLKTLILNSLHNGRTG